MISYNYCCRGRSPNEECGPAIDYCYEEEDGSLWAGNGEYESQVNFCPFCGKKAKRQMIKKADPESTLEWEWVDEDGI